ncbi:hypothetical protein EYF80_021383 [Liparis tanakae]|uniref:Uncharacterized protein n=1 Tax=Liparis tanakae TaxID=230148 RepID=A0A4Z2HRS5_9TELE|nr:hypothetical protein EYF80_021383 [Liparis tanakae]
MNFYYFFTYLLLFHYFFTFSLLLLLFITFLLPFYFFALSGLSVFSPDCDLTRSSKINPGSSQLNYLPSYVWVMRPELVSRAGGHLHPDGSLPVASCEAWEGRPGEVLPWRSALSIESKRVSLICRFSLVAACHTTSSSSSTSLEEQKEERKGGDQLVMCKLIGQRKERERKF